MSQAHTHGPEALCEAGRTLYEQALREGHVPVERGEDAPCLVDLGLLRPALDDLGFLEPVAPALALHRLLRVCEDRIADERRREARLAEIFEPLMRIGGHDPGMTHSAGIEVLSGVERINQAITEAMNAAHRELLSVQPHTHRGRRMQEAQAASLERDQALLDRGGRIRTLYQHTQRHVPFIVARYERLDGEAEARTLDEVTDRLIIIDRAVAFIPADQERTLALQIRNPALVTYLATTFDRLWRLATPMYPEAVQQPSLHGVTARQRAIAALLVEGHTDAVIADRLGMNVRTARVHIAKLAATLGSESRAQLGYLIGRSGILDRESPAPEEPRPRRAR
ncbi:LuxR C-terminal-related transcriptional regulator [Streptomyces sp. NPDC007808]|uniref:helix-turn-helix transcriptional regulator n=1 Tax=Streptomyces sp. NPDC007808 TaxID=3364779 RepID=UPI0036BAEF09